MSVPCFGPGRQNTFYICNPSLFPYAAGGVEYLAVEHFNEFLGEFFLNERKSLDLVELVESELLEIHPDVISHLALVKLAHDDLFEV